MPTARTMKSGVSLRADEDGGYVVAHGKDGKSAAALGISEHGGYVSALSARTVNQGRRSVSMKMAGVSEPLART